MQAMTKRITLQSEWYGVGYLFFAGQLRASQIRMRNAQEAHESENLESAPAVAAKSDRVTSPVSSVWVSGDEGDDDERSGSVIMPSEWSSGRLEHADSRVDADQPTDT